MPPIINKRGNEMDYMSKEKFEEIQKIEDFRSKVLKYILYKKRTENEVRQKFADANSDLLEDTIEYLKEQKYIDDEDYIRRAIDEFKALKTLSLKELKYKLVQKGINSNLVDDYICKNKDAMIKYEVSSCMKIINKKMQKMEIEEVKNYLYSKGYMSECISIAIDELGL